MIYVGIGGIAALFNLFAFLTLLTMGAGTNLSLVVAYVLAAALNYFLCISLLFHHKARWSSATEVLIYLLVTSLVGVIDLSITRSLLFTGFAPWLSKSSASLTALVINFMARRYLVFPEPSAGAWKPQMNPTDKDR
jgi:putative flippase GtrA